MQSELSGLAQESVSWSMSQSQRRNMGVLLGAGVVVPSRQGILSFPKLLGLDGQARMEIQAERDHESTTEHQTGTCLLGTTLQLMWRSVAFK